MRRPQKKSRRGTIVVLSAFLMVVIVGMVAFAVDLGYITNTRCELQNAADAAALAGASRLADRSELSGTANRSARIADAVAEAQNFAARNRAGGVYLSLDSNPENASDGDIVVGYLADPANPNSTLITDTTQTYNAVTVNARRNADRNGSIRLFFGPIFGKNTADVVADATAVFETGVSGFEITGDNPNVVTSKLLPFAMKVDVWTGVTHGSGADQWSYNPVTCGVSAGSDGILEAELYGSKTSAPGNFGTVNIGAPNNSTNDVVRQILYGPNQSDFNHLGGRLALGADGTTTLTGDPGLSAGFKSALEAIIGQPRIVPLYSNLTGNGANSQFTICGFAGVIITQVRLTGPNKSVTIQPEYVIDASGIRNGNTGTSPSFINRPLQLVR